MWTFVSNCHVLSKKFQWDHLSVLTRVLFAIASFLFECTLKLRLWAICCVAFTLVDRVACDFFVYWHSLLFVYYRSWDRIALWAVVFIAQPLWFTALGTSCVHLYCSGQLSLLPSVRRTVNEYQLINNNKWRWWL